MWKHLRSCGLFHLKPLHEGADLVPPSHLRIAGRSHSLQEATVVADGDDLRLIEALAAFLAHQAELRRGGPGDDLIVVTDFADDRVFEVRTGAISRVRVSRAFWHAAVTRRGLAIAVDIVAAIRPAFGRVAVVNVVRVVGETRGRRRAPALPRCFAFCTIGLYGASAALVPLSAEGCTA